MSETYLEAQPFLDPGKENVASYPSNSEHELVLPPSRRTTWAKWPFLLHLAAFVIYSIGFLLSMGRSVNTSITPEFLHCMNILHK